MLFLTLDYPYSPPKKKKRKKKSKSTKIIHGYKHLKSSKFTENANNKKLKTILKKKRIIKQNPIDVEKVYRNFFRPLVLFCDSRIHSIYDSEEIVQEVFINMLLNQSKLDSTCIKSWLRENILLRISNYTRKKKNRERILIMVKYSEVDEAKFHYTFEYSEDILKIIQNELSKKDYDFFLKYILSPNAKVYGETENESETLSSNAINTKKCRIRKKIHKILEKHGILDKDKKQ